MMVPLIMEATRENDRLYERVMNESQSKRSITPSVLSLLQLKDAAIVSPNKTSKKRKTEAGAEPTYTCAKSSGDLPTS